MNYRFLNGVHRVKKTYMSKIKRLIREDGTAFYTRTICMVLHDGVVVEMPIFSDSKDSLKITRVSSTATITS